MASDDDDEMAQLRAQRRAALGTAGLTVTALRERQQRELEKRSDVGSEMMPRGQASHTFNGADSDDDEDAPTVVGAVEEGAMQYDDDLRANFPMAFGGQEKAAPKLEAVHAATVRQEFTGSVPDGEALSLPKPPITDAAGGAELDDADRRRQVESGESDEDDEEEGDPYLLPITHEVSFEGQEKMVIALDVDKSGARALSGAEDYKLKMFDFGGMKRDMRAFRTLEPEDSYPVNAISFSPTGDAFLVVTGSSQPKIFDRDGHELGQFIKGDMYIRDLKNTKGHQYRCCSGQWHPTDRHTAMSCSEDGSVRIWDTEALTQRTVLKPTLSKPGRFTVSACAYNSDGGMIAAGLKDGSIQMWDVRGKFGRSAAVGQVAVPKAQMLGKQDWSYISGARQLARGAHEADEDITSLRFSADNNTLLSRSEDATLKVWDARKLKLPVKVFDGLPAARQSGVCFSPDESLIVTGTEAGRDGNGGALLFFDRQRMEFVRRIAMNASVSALIWHERLNQIFVGTGNRKAGGTRVLYDPSYSEKGVLLCAGRAPRAANPLDFELPLVIKNPHALPLYREDDGHSRKRPYERMADEAVRTRRPDPGAGVAGLGLGKGGKIGATGGTLLTQYILQNQGLMDKPAEEDIRAAILRHEGKTDNFTKFTDAYKDTQPKPIFAEEEVDEYLEK